MTYEPDPRLFPWENAGIEHDQWTRVVREAYRRHVEAANERRRFLEQDETLVDVVEAERLRRADEAAAALWHAVARGEPRPTNDLLDELEADE